MQSSQRARNGVNRNKRSTNITKGTKTSCKKMRKVQVRRLDLFCCQPRRFSFSQFVAFKTTRGCDCKDGIWAQVTTKNGFFFLLPDQNLCIPFAALVCYRVAQGCRCLRRSGLVLSSSALTSMLSVMFLSTRRSKLRIITARRDRLQCSICVGMSF